MSYASSSSPSSSPLGPRLTAVRARVRERLTATSAVAATLSGQLSRDAYATYLTNAFHYATHSPRVMAIAAARSMGTHPELADYLLKHASEERGHDAWALDDLVQLGVDAEAARASAPVPACAAMIGYMHYLAGVANPIALYGWMYVLEAVGEDLGAKIGTQLAKDLGGGTRFVANHGLSDVEHTQEMEAVILRYVTRPEDVEDVARAAEVVADLYVRMFRQVGGEDL